MQELAKKATMPLGFFRLNWKTATKNMQNASKGTMRCKKKLGQLMADYSGSKGDVKGRKILEVPKHVEKPKR